MITQEQTQEARKIEAELQEARDFTTVLKEKSALHKFLSIATKAYLDGMQAALKCQKAAQTAAI